VDNFRRLAENLLQHIRAPLEAVRRIITAKIRLKHLSFPLYFIFTDEFFHFLLQDVILLNMNYCVVCPLVTLTSSSSFPPSSNQAEHGSLPPFTTLPCCVCSSVTAVRLPDGLSFVVYEFWDGEEEWKR